MKEELEQITVVYNSNKFVIDSIPNEFSELLFLCSKHFRIVNSVELYLTYKDEDGDDIEISNQDEYAENIASCAISEFTLNIRDFNKEFNESFSQSIHYNTNGKAEGMNSVFVDGFEGIGDVLNQDGNSIMDMQIIEKDLEMLNDKEVKKNEEKERLEKERLEQEKIEKERLEKERLEQERLEKERLEKERLEKERLEKERLEKERLEKERLEKERLEKERLEKERLEKERLEKERLEKERLEKERLEKERLEKERLEKERLEKERLEKERLEKERLEKERLEKERLEKERLEKERLEKERLEKERLEKERLEKERLEKERLEKERLEKERLEKERLEKERLEKERLEKERLEKERLEKERLEKERLEREKLETESSQYLSSYDTYLSQLKSHQTELTNKLHTNLETIITQKLSSFQNDLMKTSTTEFEKLISASMLKLTTLEKSRQNQYKAELSKIPTSHIYLSTQSIHVGVMCNKCKQNPITGSRYKCQICNNYDLCELCEEKNAETNEHPHNFIRMRNPKPIQYHLKCLTKPQSLVLRITEKVDKSFRFNFKVTNFCNYSYPPTAKIIVEHKIVKGEPFLLKELAPKKECSVSFLLTNLDKLPVGTNEIKFKLDINGKYFGDEIKGKIIVSKAENTALIIQDFRDNFGFSKEDHSDAKLAEVLKKADNDYQRAINFLLDQN